MRNAGRHQVGITDGDNGTMLSSLFCRGGYGDLAGKMKARRCTLI